MPPSPARTKPRTLLVDDDTTTLALTADILEPEAEVVGVANAIEALRLVVTSEFDLLITDLDIQHPGDGLLLASAMKYAHPEACTVLVTGLPDFTRAVRELQASIDLTLVKPVDARQLRDLPDLTQNGQHHRRQLSQAGKSSVWDILDRRQSAVIDQWYEQVRADPRLSGVHLTREQRLNHLPALLRALTSGRKHVGAREHAFPVERSPEQRAAARLHGHTRKKQGYQPHWLSLETTYLRRDIVQMILNELIEVEMSTFLPDVLDLYERLDESLLDSLEAFGLQNP